MHLTGGIASGGIAAGMVATSGEGRFIDFSSG
jgi:hypothetical protein